MNKKSQRKKYPHDFDLNDFDKEVLERINRNFLSEDFFKALLEVTYTNEENSDDSQTSPADEETLFQKFLDFAKECYIHGITVGLKIAAELYDEYYKYYDR